MAEDIKQETEQDDSDDLLPNEIKALETEVRNELRKEQRKQKREDLKKALRNRMRQQKGLAEKQEEVFIDLAKHADRITIDGIQYLQGQTYTVKESLARELRWIMQSTHEHQAEIDGKTKRYYTEKHARISPVPGSNVNTSSSLLRV